ncbi:hypothetical protein [Streptomonospora nanhaiensis]|uniref:Uncharacterized protein n=1 Tax=Streptomonospora nanhaiensis TaxID=1323731 RepID=A0A853BP47_9ACTN|nr:hypothetical protein [Streptomonospora nanhaiensis]MBV2361765.1 hypothetical protein [Streptomonospora nanhaiensis]NYI96416.1 hypothetical protein [Streptomonospora nanhaiensis]
MTNVQKTVATTAGGISADKTSSIERAPLPCCYFMQQLPHGGAPLDPVRPAVRRPRPYTGVDIGKHQQALTS